MSSIPTLEEAADFVFPLLRQSKEVIEGAINSGSLTASQESTSGGRLTHVANSFSRNVVMMRYEQRRERAETREAANLPQTRELEDARAKALELASALEQALATLTTAP